jgi:hypothetical protein
VFLILSTKKPTKKTKGTKGEKKRTEQENQLLARARPTISVVAVDEGPLGGHGRNGGKGREGGEIERKEEAKRA